MNKVLSLKYYACLGVLESLSDEELIKLKDQIYEEKSARQDVRYAAYRQAKLEEVMEYGTKYIPELSTCLDMSFEVEGIRYNFLARRHDYDGRSVCVSRYVDEKTQEAMEVFLSTGECHVYEDWTPSKRLIDFSRFLINSTFFE